MRAIRKAKATVTLILVVFLAVFLVVSYSRLSPPPVGAPRSRQFPRRGVETASASASTSAEYQQQAAEQPSVHVKAPDKSIIEGEDYYARKSYIAARKLEVVTASTTSTTKATMRRSTPIADLSKYRRAHNVSIRWRSWWPNRNRKSNEARLFTRPRFQLPNWGRKLNKTRLSFGPAFKWPNWDRRLNKTQLFKDRLTPSERATLLAMFGAVTDALRASNVTFWMDGGTLLGSYRHHNLIPWDDDVDLVLQRSQKRQARRAIKALAPAYRLFIEKDAGSSSELLWRVFARNASVPVTTKTFRFPTVDLHFYAENATHVWLEPRNLWRHLVWRRRRVFPLYLRPFDRYWAPAPCNTRTYLIKEFDRQLIDVCTSPRTSHSNNIGQRRSFVPCRTLRRVPFVERKRDGAGSVTETLLRGDTKIHQLVVHPKCAV